MQLMRYNLQTIFDYVIQSSEIGNVTILWCCSTFLNISSNYCEYTIFCWGGGNHSYYRSKDKLFHKLDVHDSFNFTTKCICTVYNYTLTWFQETLIGQAGWSLRDAFQAHSSQFQTIGFASCFTGIVSSALICTWLVEELLFILANSFYEINKIFSINSPPEQWTGV